MNFKTIMIILLNHWEVPTCVAKLKQVVRVIENRFIEKTIKQRSPTLVKRAKLS